MHDRGPALRSKVAHSIINLDAALHDQVDTNLGRLCEVLAVCFVSMCTTLRMENISKKYCSNQRQDLAVARKHLNDDVKVNEPVEACIRQMQCYQAVFHGHTILNRALRQSLHTVNEAENFLKVGTPWITESHMFCTPHKSRNHFGCRTATLNRGCG